MLTERVVRGRQNPLYLKLPARLRRARLADKRSAEALSAAAGVGKSCVSQLEAKTRIPRLPTVERIANALRVSPAWLAFGLEAQYEPATIPGELRCAGLAARAMAARELRQLSLNEAGRRLGSFASAIRAVEAGGMPSLDTVEAIAKVLGVSPSWLAYGIGPMEAPSRRRSAAAAHP